MADAEGFWAAKSDDELLEAAADLSEFTEDGERVIRAELRRRGLPSPEPAIGRCARCGRSIFATTSQPRCSRCSERYPDSVRDELARRSADAEPVPVFRSSDAGLLSLAKSLLEGEDIRFLVRGEDLQDLIGVGRLGGANYITGPAEIWVRADDVARARGLLDGLDTAGSEPGGDTNDDA